MKNVQTKRMVLIASFAALTAIGAFIKIPIPVVPFTLQIIVVFLAGVLLGSKGALYSQLVYIAVGLAGVPVFNEGGGIMYIFKPSFGYLLGFALAAYCIGWVIERIKQPQFIHFVIANLLGVCCIYLIGIPYLYAMLNIWVGQTTSIKYAIMVGFSAGFFVDLILACVTAILSKRLYDTIVQRYMLV